MGFYIRKSVSAGPFRFNLSRSGLGVSVGVKGFRLGSGPRGNYVHMGRGGLYYRVSLGRPRRSSGVGSLGSAPYRPAQSPLPGDPLAAVEVGNVLEMVPSNRSEIVRQINEKMGCVRFWPWVLGGGLASSAVLAGEPAGQQFALALILCTTALTALVAYLDIQRKTFVIIYDLNAHITSSLQTFANEFNKVASASRIWNIDSAGRSFDWKRNAGAGHMITRKRATFGYSVPKVIKTNVDVPSIVGGRQAIYFFPDVVLITDGNNVGAISYDDLNIYWNTTVFIEDDSVPSDARVVGYTWRFVNRSGAPDQRFNNNKRLPQVLYQQMGLQGTGSFQKILHISKVEDRGGFDTALASLRLLISCLARDASAIKDWPGDDLVQSEESPSPRLLAPPNQGVQPGNERVEQAANIRNGRSLTLPLLLMAVGTVFAVVLTLGLYFRFSGPSAVGPTLPVASAPPTGTYPGRALHPVPINLFVAYPAGPIYTGPHAAPDLTEPQNYSFRTRIRAASRKAPNFAGRWVLVNWGCGTGCSDGRLVNLATGAVLSLPAAVISGPLPDPTADAYTYTRESRLLIVNGHDGESDTTAYRLRCYVPNDAVTPDLTQQECSAPATLDIPYSIRQENMSSPTRASPGSPSSPRLFGSSDLYHPPALATTPPKCFVVYPAVPPADCFAACHR
jgi:hypothetical protein